MARMPEDVRRQVIIELFRRADSLDWDGLQQTDKSVWYARWLDEPEIGGVLEKFMPRDKARIWIKDTPMKHYNRARSGIGPYADLVGSKLPDAPTLVRLAFGEGWTVLPSTLRDKPNRCAIRKNDDLRQILWGGSKSFPSLVWASINAIVDAGPAPVILVVTRQGERLSDGQIARHCQIGELIGVELRHVTAGAMVSSGLVGMG
ncbi:hypothetical protein [Catellatospora tritici]|uniref:hypothetical protein n=1 Tax=Catellatospora tritici TaxID=2851566 RepID=UPI001C2D7638|nr:hypothetical protein [Catellatospora tritici]MBV1849358.1 hypothetical protein [Catellatospora tritici]